MHFEADLIILDEPTVALSLKEVRRVLDFVHRIKENGKACVYISHDIQDVYEIADRFVVIDRGEVVASIDKPDTSLTELQDFLLKYAPRQKITDAEPWKTALPYFRVSPVSRVCRSPSSWPC